MPDNNLQNQFVKNQEIGVMPDFQPNRRNSDNQQFSQQYLQKRNTSGGLLNQPEMEQPNNMFNNNPQYPNQMPVTINGTNPLVSSNPLTNRPFPHKMANQGQMFSQPQQIMPQMPPQDLMAQIAEMRKEIEDLKNDAIKKEEDIRTLFKNSGKISSSSSVIQTDDDDEYKIFAPIPNMPNKIINMPIPIIIL